MYRLCVLPERPFSICVFFLIVRVYIAGARLAG